MTEIFLKQHKKMPMRTIDICGSQTLEDLHNAIFKAFDRFDQHLFEFQIGGMKPMDKKSIRYGILGFDDDMEENIKDATTATIASLILMPGDFFFYWFDNLLVGESTSSFGVVNVAPSSRSTRAVWPMRRVTAPPAGASSRYSCRCRSYSKTAPSLKSVREMSSESQGAG
ncbi:MAG: plasmid pRiA4b ORF-3 family protein [Desulfovibrio sp.]|nr:plasmid pRiA4b ORF-3 family protein [Desulfovibrio sp.]